MDDISGKNRLDVLSKSGRSDAVITDLALIFGGGYYRGYSKDAPLERMGQYVTRSSENIDGYSYPIVFYYSTGNARPFLTFDPSARNFSIRPVIRTRLVLDDRDGRGFKRVHTSKLYYDMVATSFEEKDGVRTVLFGEYPQYAPDKEIQEQLEREFSSNRLISTEKSYTFDGNDVNASEKPFKPVSYDEYQYNGKKYVRVKVTNRFGTSEFGVTLNNGGTYKGGDHVWIEVSPVKWIIDTDSKYLISSRCLLSGIRVSDVNQYHGNFYETEMQMYLSHYMLPDIVKKSEVKEVVQENGYGFNFDNVSEEDIIRGAVESGIGVFLHGPSSEGKSTRVKQIDPDCEIVYLRNASPESLNGKSVYNSETGEMIDVPPTWLKRLKRKCEEEPDKIHILFFDELTNALPSIQGFAFNIVLDREVNGIWKLPDNARIVAAGNEMADSLAANEMPEPLFNRFAHVYIRTTTEQWLKWASENNIHPAIYAYIAYTHGNALRSEYDGKRPNADPRKWEMASKMLYHTNNPEVLRALVGEDITREFVAFCRSSVITLDGVLKGAYNNEALFTLNTAQRYATVMGLSMVDETNFELVRDFVSKLGAEFLSLFDSMWSHGDEHRLEKIAEIKLTGNKKTGYK